MHLLFQQISDELNRKGHSVQDLMNKLQFIEIMPTETVIKGIFQGICKAQYHTSHTSELTSDQVDKVYDVFNKWLGQEFEVHYPFPSKEDE